MDILCAGQYLVHRDIRYLFLFDKFYLKNLEDGGKKGKKESVQFNEIIQFRATSHLQLCKIFKFLGILNFTSVNSTDWE